MVSRVAGRPVDQRGVGIVFTIVDENGPDVDENEEGDIGEFLKREQEWEEMVWNGLSKSIKRMESMRGERCRHDPLMVGFMQVFVDDGIM